MPELPDVETFRRYLEEHGLSRPIERVVVRDRRLLRGESGSGLAGLPGRRLTTTRRHGKYLFAEAPGAGWLVFHFGMTGSLERFGKGKEPRSSAVVASVLFADGSGIAFLDPRKLGRFGLVEDPGVFVDSRGLGPDALDLDRSGFERIAAKRRGSVKALLMDQTAIAGVGNLYADEILFRAQLHPQTQVGTLDDEGRGRLFEEMKRVLRTAVARGADTRRLPRGYLLRHRDADGRCPRCGSALQKIRVAGRTSWFCPRHQPKGRSVASPGVSEAGSRHRAPGRAAAGATRASVRRAARTRRSPRHR